MMEIVTGINLRCARKLSKSSKKVKFESDYSEIGSRKLQICSPVPALPPCCLQAAIFMILVVSSFCSSPPSSSHHHGWAWITWYMLITSVEIELISILCACVYRTSCSIHDSRDAGVSDEWVLWQRHWITWFRLWRHWGICASQWGAVSNNRGNQRCGLRLKATIKRHEHA